MSDPSRQRGERGKVRILLRFESSLLQRSILGGENAMHARDESRNENGCHDKGHKHALQMPVVAFATAR
ncbi:MAG: hypothetical protein EAZ84_13630 [Verrucomicrobia bacterium]|nr:MAG: hypothetical protein EAZ84_13630 [Verrucomicrobiota bacterium]